MIFSENIGIQTDDSGIDFHSVEGKNNTIEVNDYHQQKTIF